ncbi:LOW QUALITY PROTEIN: Zinc finger protein 862, partial [Frankliniella fusca]
WLAENPAGRKDNKGAKCLVCEIPLRAHHTDLLKHATQSKTHLANMDKYNVQKQRRLDAVGVHVGSDERRAMDLRLAVFIACHSAIRSIDHLSEILAVIGKGSKLEDVKLHRTKCSRLITSVISPAMLTELVEDVGEQGYSLIIDESTDISVVKFMAVMIKYHSVTSNEIVTDFLGFIEVYRATAEALFYHLPNFWVGLDYKKVIGLGTDGASNLCGKHNSVYSRFRDEIPDVVLVRCVCHSLHGAASKAAAQLPADLEFLVRETRNWFAKSPLKRLQYKDLFAAINDGAMPQALVQLVRTRWLAWGKAVGVILSQWLELKTHFQVLSNQNDPNEKCFVGRRLSECFSEPNYLFLLFVHPIATEVNRINLAFQAREAEWLRYDPGELQVTALLAELHDLVLWVARKVCRPEAVPNNEQGAVLTDAQQEMLRVSLDDPQCILPLAQVDYGPKFSIHLGKVAIDPPLLKEIQTRCRSYLIVLAKNILQVLPEHGSRLAALRHFHPEECLRRGPQRARVLQLPLYLAAPGADVDILQRQWDALPHTNWENYFGGKIPSTSIAFWKGVWTYTRLGQRPFEELARFALRAQSLPFSNAVVEQAFSVMNAIKIKSRNRMGVELLMAIMRIRLRLQGSKMCCHEFQPSKRMITMITSDMYSQSKEGVNVQEGEGVGDIDIVDVEVDLDFV